jgi:hypothetical protein
MAFSLRDRVILIDDRYVQIALSEPTRRQAVDSSGGLTTLLIGCGKWVDYALEKPVHGLSGTWGDPVSSEVRPFGPFRNDRSWQRLWITL